MTFDQVFYGRGPQGYAVLGDSGCPFEVISHAESLCQLHGTPDARSVTSLKPFLFQHFSCGRVYLGCGMLGQKDDLGRSTLFYHVIVGDADEARSVGLSTRDLFQHGLFVDRQVDQKVEKVDVDVRAWRIEQSVARCSLERPAVVVCESDASHKVLDLIGAEIARINWTSCCWNISGAFEVLGTPLSYLADTASSNFNIYDDTGKLLQRRQAQNQTFAKTAKCCDVAAGSVNEKTASTEPQKPSNVSRKGWVVALLVGFVLGCIVGAWTVGSEKEIPPEPKTIIFNENFRIGDFDAALKKAGLDEILKSIYDERSKSVEALFSKFRAYCDFVNRNFPKKK